MRILKEFIKSFGGKNAHIFKEAGGGGVHVDVDGRKTKVLTLLNIKNYSEVF